MARERKRKNVLGMREQGSVRRDVHRVPPFIKGHLRRDGQEKGEKGFDDSNKERCDPRNQS